MSLVTHGFDLPIMPGSISPVLHLSQYDDARAFTAHLKDESGNPFTLPSGATATLHGKNRKGVTFDIEATVSGAEVTFTPKEAATDQPGEIHATLCITSGGEQLTPLAITLDIQKDGATKEDIARSPGFEEQIQAAVEAWLNEHGGGLPPGGTAGQYLVSDGNGGGVWVDAAPSGDDVPLYVMAEAQGVANRVRSKLQNDSIVFMVGSDSHQDDTDSDIVSGNVHGGMAMKILANALSLDFVSYLGDFTWGSSTTTISEGLSHIDEINADIADAFNGLPQFRTVGNHDPLGYSYSQNGAALTHAQLYAKIGKFNADNGAVMGSTTSGYCYRDFTSKRVRVICLNTAETDTSGNNPPHGNAENVTDAQKKWFADTLISTPSGYGIIVLAHHPLDWGNIMATSHVLRAYVEEQSGVNVGGTVYDFSNKNKSAWVVQFHGHVHSYKVDNLHWNNGGVGTAYDVKRIAVPNMCFLRNNEYGRNSDTEYYGIEFGESTTYNKTANSGDDTAFCVMVVNPSEQKVHAICYGAGYDREIYFGDDSVAVTGVTLNAASGTLAPGASTTLTATVAPSDATNKTVLWSTSNASVATVTNGVVTAVGVGSATITATTQDGGFTASYALTVSSTATNIVPFMHATNSTDIFNEAGYKDNSYISGAAEGTANGHVATGFYSLQNASNMSYLYIRGANITSDDYCRFLLVRDSDNTNTSYSVKGNSTNGWASLDWFDSVEQLGTKYWKITLNKSFASSYMTSTVRAMRMSVEGVGAELFISIDNPISDEVYNAFLGS